MALLPNTHASHDDYYTAFPLLVLGFALSCAFLRLGHQSAMGLVEADDGRSTLHHGDLVSISVWVKEWQLLSSGVVSLMMDDVQAGTMST